MAILLLNLRDVPDDEADAIRALLDTHGIDWYETRPSPWGVSSGGIWARNDDQVELAREHLAMFQHQRATTARAEYEADIDAGRVDTVWQRIRRRPLHSLLVLAGMIVVIVLGLAMLPVVLMR